MIKVVDTEKSEEEILAMYNEALEVTCPPLETKERKEKKIKLECAHRKNKGGSGTRCEVEVVPRL